MRLSVISREKRMRGREREREGGRRAGVKC